jgi:superfamily II DNA or RNA helicase
MRRVPVRRGAAGPARAKATAKQPQQQQQPKLTTGLSQRGYWVRKRLDADETGGLDEATVRRLKTELTMVPLDTTGGMGGQGQGQGGGGGGPTAFPIYRESRSKLYLPKCFGLERYGVPPPERDTLDPGEDVVPALRFAGGLRPEQMEPIDAFMAAARDPARMGGILSMPCGFGKTVVALHLVAALGKRAMVVVHKDFLLNQWRERIAEFLPGARVGLLKAKTVDVEGKDIVIASLQSLSMKDYEPGLFKGIGFLVIDECHRVGTEVFSRALFKTNFRYSLGISATVQRKDGMTKAFSAFLGAVLFKGKRRSDEVLVVQQRFWDPDPAYGREVMIGGLGKPNISRMINNISEFAPRTAAVVDAVVAVLRHPGQAGRKVLVLSDRKRQLTDVRAGLEAAGVTAGFYWGGMKPAALAETEATKQVMCATFAYAAEGMDVPGLDTLVLASPRSDIEQSCGRILRLKAAARVRLPLVVDLVDAFSLFERQGAKRAAFYRKHRYTVYPELADALRCCGGASDPAVPERPNDDEDEDEDDDEAAAAAAAAATAASSAGWDKGWCGLDDG